MNTVTARIVPLCGVLLLATLAGCRGLAPAPALPPQASVPATACIDGTRPMVRDTLYLGRSRPGGRIGADDWQRFVDDVVVPRFPDGFTLVSAEGYWRAGDGAIASEPSTLLIVLHDGDVAATAGIAEIAADYKRRFKQEAVLRERGPTCAGF